MGGERDRNMKNICEIEGNGCDREKMERMNNTL